MRSSAPREQRSTIRHVPYGLPSHPIEEHEAKDHAIRDLYERLDKIETGRQSLINALWAQIPSDITETVYSATAKTVATTPQTSELVKITSFVATLPATSTGTLQLGDVTIPLPSGLSTATGLRLLLRQTDLRLLKSTKTGPMSLTICGQIAPTRGVL